MIELAPSLLAADVMHLGREIEMMLSHQVDLLHFDVMDAHFVPNLSFGPALCQTIHERYPACRLDVHLMMDNPEKYLGAFAKAGAYTLTLHQEVLEEPAAVLDKIKREGMRCGLSVKPGTRAETLLPYLELLDYILIMTVEPGFGGQKFMPEQIGKIKLLRDAGYRGDISVDGGVNLQNAPLLAQAGANVLVMGTAYFRADDPEKVARAVKEL